MAIGLSTMMHGVRPSSNPDVGSASGLARSPSPIHPAFVSLRPLKEVVRKLAPVHPLRILLLGEPDELPAAEFASKVGGWLRLLPTE